MFVGVTAKVAAQYALTSDILHYSAAAAAVAAAAAALKAL